MCDFSLTAVRSRAAKVGDRLITKDFGHGTRGFADVNDIDCAVCVQPGTEIAFDEAITRHDNFCGSSHLKNSGHKVAIFRQINKERLATHHDAMETPDGETVLLTLLCGDQHATVLQLPAKPKTDAEREAQKRLLVTG